MSDTNQEQSKTTNKVMHYGMMVCCTVMLLPVAGFFVAGGTVAGLWTNFAVFAPIALCVGSHVLLFKLFGKSCHKTKSDETKVATPIAAMSPERSKVLAMPRVTT